MKRRGLLPATSSTREYTAVLSARPKLPEKMAVPTDYQSNRMFAAKGLSWFSLFFSHFFEF